MSKVTNLRFKESDGDDLDDSYTTSVFIEVVENGWAVTVVGGDDEEETRHVFEFTSGPEMLIFIQESLGAI